MVPSGLVVTAVPGGNTLPPRDIEPSGLFVILVPAGSVLADTPGVCVTVSNYMKSTEKCIIQYEKLSKDI